MIHPFFLKILHHKDESIITDFGGNAIELGFGFEISLTPEMGVLEKQYQECVALFPPVKSEGTSCSWIYCNGAGRYWSLIFWGEPEEHYSLNIDMKYLYDKDNLAKIMPSI